MMKYLGSILLALTVACGLQAANTVPFGKGRLTVKNVARNAVRIVYEETPAAEPLPDWVYVKSDEMAKSDLTVKTDARRQTLTIKDKQGKTLFTATSHQLADGVATMAFRSAKDEYMFGLGQFQDGYTNVRGLSRRLTQVNTQISIPMVISNKGYGVLWNNYGMTEFNPQPLSVRLTKLDQAGVREEVDVTSTEGGKKEVRERHIFTGTIDVPATADYSLLLDVGQKMARRHNLVIDGRPVIEMQNLWLPPTASAIVHLTAGRHELKAELTKDDQPVLYYGPVSDETVFRSPVAQVVDYTVFTGSADDIVATYRELTGAAPAAMGLGLHPLPRAFPLSGRAARRGPPVPRAQPARRRHRAGLAVLGQERLELDDVRPRQLSRPARHGRQPAPYGLPPHALRMVED